MHKTAKNRPAFSLAIACASITAVSASAPAKAVVVPFTGSATATAIVSADASCAPLPFRGIVLPETSSGTSNLGGFSYSQTTCFQGAIGGPVIGIFSIDFGTSSFSGLLNGISAPRAGVPGVSDQFFDYTVTSGTGRFAGATGSFTNVGFVDNRSGPPSRLTLNFEGTIDAPAIPEPASWALMIAGFGLVGAAGRRRKQHALAN